MSEQIKFNPENIQVISGKEKDLMPCCRNCMFSRQKGMDLTSIRCYEGPPQIFAFMNNVGGLVVQSMQAPVQPEGFCYRYQPDPDQVPVQPERNEDEKTDGAEG